MTWRRTWWVVFVANLITSIGMMSFLPFFPSILEELGVAEERARMVWAGVLFGAAPLAAAIMGPIWGSIGDRYGRKLMVIRALLAITVFVGAMGFARSPWVLLALRLGQGVFSGFIPPSITLVSIAAPRDRQGRVTSTLQAALPAGMILGPVFGHFVAELFGVTSVFFFVAGMAASSALLVALFAHEDPSLLLTIEHFSPTSSLHEPRTPGPAASMRALLAEALGDLRRLFANRNIRWALLLLFAEQFGLGATNPLLEIHVENLLDAGPGEAADRTAWLFSALAVAGVVATPLWGRLGDRIGHDKALLASAISSGLLLGFHALAASYAALFSLRIALGATTPGSNVAAFGIAALETEHDRRGGAFGAVFSARALAVSIGATLGGALSSLFGIHALFVLTGAGILALLWAFRLQRSSSKAA